MVLRRVLIVDDDPAVRDALVDVLADEGFIATAAADGAQALSWLRSQRDFAGVVLLDIMMPVMDGYAFLVAKENDPTIAEVP